jgi:hypothetical protein
MLRAEEFRNERQKKQRAGIIHNKNSKVYTNMWDLQSKLSVVNKIISGDLPERSNVFMTEPHIDAPQIAT